MDAVIWANQVFYGGQLRTADCLPNMSVWNLGCYRSEVRLMWIHVKHDEHSLTPGGGDLTNNGEPPTSGSAYAVGWTSFAIFRKRPTQHAITSTSSSADPRSYQLESHDGSRKHDGN